MDRVILHSDLNNFYASVECFLNPSLRGQAVAVAGDQEMRHGIVLAKNSIAKAFGVTTGSTLWEARRKCPDIIFVKPHFELYKKYSDSVRQIYGEYTDQIEPFGLDECWLDVTGSQNLFGDGKTIANNIRERIKTEIGITVSVGVSFNKIFAKLGSDMKKPDATTVIDRDNFREKVWRLPVSDLLYVGHKTANKLKSYGIETIGALASADSKLLMYLLGKNGIMLKEFACGKDNSPVLRFCDMSPVKSIGNSTTTPRDLVSEEDIRITLYALCESVSSRMRRHGFICDTVQVSIRDSDLYTFDRQAKLDTPNRTAKALFEKSIELYRRHHIHGKPVRSLGVRACGLSSDKDCQLSFLPELEKLDREEKIESIMDSLRGRFGSSAMNRGICITDAELSRIGPSEDGAVLPPAVRLSH